MVSRLVTTEVRVHQVKMGILRDDGFSAAPPLEVVRPLVSLMSPMRLVFRTCS